MSSGNALQLERFLAEVSKRAFVMAELATQDREEALDLVQDAMLAFAARYARTPEAEWRPLFYRVMQNKLRDWHRRARIRRRWRIWLHHEDDCEEGSDPIQGMADPSAVLPESALAQDASLKEVLRALAELPERQRQAVLLRVWEGFDVAATAAAMGCSAGSVKTHLSRGLARLRERLESNI